MTKNLTCIICPRGCQLTATLDENGVFLSVEGYTCQRGKKYAEDECTHPVRTVTSTVKAQNGNVVPVKTSKAIPKELIFECMKEINCAVVKLPVKIGDIVISNVLNTGADIVVTANEEN